MKPISLTPTERAFLERLNGYCAAGLTQSEMAEQEGFSLSSFRDAYTRLGFEIASRTIREVVRLRSGETFASLLTAGAITTQDEREPETASVA